MHGLWVWGSLAAMNGWIIGVTSNTLKGAASSISDAHPADMELKSWEAVESPSSTLQPTNIFTLRTDWEAFIAFFDHGAVVLLDVAGICCIGTSLTICVAGDGSKTPGQSNDVGRASALHCLARLCDQAATWLTS
ncbi:hypothetical protein SODALDRAFT_362431 [Sodiomyces alkalinus F11]|uniref:Secreted protein n=1 Tax=Sodiomyces alkalinus (strain CBS 110278 / VKM F-3762 / F11) TaxID=1314773 RepID=A0A3N2PQ22_SODAK|nr:hypothetical protein SODALDRAFT_362431 [Sodiomyces alkalinus F11]ROT36611.1 hypothetical protein SODALDRAFT_362431 [Sodiomyces alkalinus F11]